MHFGLFPGGHFFYFPEYIMIISYPIDCSIWPCYLFSEQLAL
jgi:hypothetical protein